jgi:hypothetical protein
MSPELQEIFDLRMRPTTMHALLAVKWWDVEDAVEACINELDAGRINRDDVKPFMQSRFQNLEGLQKALVIGNATVRARTCYLDLQVWREAV